MKFTEYDGMILLQSAETAARNVSRMKEEDTEYSRWRYERYTNHTHARMSAIDRDHVRQELLIVEDFAIELRQAYPDRAFVISHIPCYAVSFYQAIEDAPTEGVIPVKGNRREGEAWCQTCVCYQSYTPLPSPDAEFPQAEWGRCSICGTDVITQYGEILTLLPVVSP